MSGLDIGSSLWRSRFVFPLIVTRLHDLQVTITTSQCLYCTLSLYHPCVIGAITSTTCIQTLWQLVFSLLRMCVPSKSEWVHNNNKPWFSKDIKILWREKARAFRSEDNNLYKLAKYKFAKAVKKAKKDYWEHKLSSKDSFVWHSFQLMTNYKGCQAAPPVTLTSQMN